MEIVLGIALILLGGYLVVFQRKKLAAETLEIQSQDTKTIPEVREALEAMASIDPNYRELVEVKGIAQSEQPVMAPYTGERVAYYMAQTVQVSESTETYTDSKGNRRSRTVRRTDTLCEEESNVPLLLKDSNGDEIVIETNGIGSRLDLQRTCDRMDNTCDSRRGRTSVSINNFNISFGGGHRIIGYKKIEDTFRLNAPLYALGEAYMQNGRIYLGPPKSPDAPFIVTTKSEQQLVQNKKNAQNLSLFGGIACVVIGIVLMITYF